jgi:hypothetical protein
MRPYRYGFAFLVVAFGVVLGCGPTSQTPAKLTGLVTYNGTPLKAGNVTFHTDMGRYNAPIAEDGTYDVVDLPAGDAKVTVDTEFLNPDKKGPDYSVTGKMKAGAAARMAKTVAKAPPKAAAKTDKLAAERAAVEKERGLGPPSAEFLAARYTRIPPKYHLLQTTPLKTNLEAGRHTWDIELVD